MHDRCSQETRNKQNPHPAPPPQGQPAGRGPVASGPNSVPNTKPPAPIPAPFQDTSPPKGTTASVLGRKKKPAAAIR